MPLESDEVSVNTNNWSISDRNCQETVIWAGSARSRRSVGYLTIRRTSPLSSQTVSHTILIPGAGPVTITEAPLGLHPWNHAWRSGVIEFRGVRGTTGVLRLESDKVALECPDDCSDVRYRPDRRLVLPRLNSPDLNKTGTATFSHEDLNCPPHNEAITSGSVWTYYPTYTGASEQQSWVCAGRDYRRRSEGVVIVFRMAVGEGTGFSIPGVGLITIVNPPVGKELPIAELHQARLRLRTDSGLNGTLRLAWNPRRIRLILGGKVYRG
jgi:hypothetical protein